MFQSSEIYGGFGSTWDYGPLGMELKRNVKEAWWQSVISGRDDMVGLDAASVPRLRGRTAARMSFAIKTLQARLCRG